tara:strand:+ start:21 stop:2684 length:2664 start_codon:yes stop_codon:yes gene_type:complete
MKFLFDSNQQHQIEAINSIVELFNGQQKIKYSNDFKLEDSFEVICSNPNTLTISSEVLTNNLLDIQSKNQIESLIDLNEPDKNGKKNFEFTVEMETGTGKTYIYLRSIYELNKHYGFSKFVIIVPSLAIKEGVIQTYEQTKNHFKNLYKDINVEFNVLNTNKLSSVRNFCNSNSIQVMLINIDLINKIGTGSSTTTNKMYTIQESFSSSAPIEFIKSTNPVIFLDEPQKLSGIKSKKGIENLNGIFSIGFSATPKYNKNLIYQLSPIDAFNNGLVKKIHVAGIINESSSDIYLDLKSIKSIKNNLIAEIEVDFLNTSNEYEKKVIAFKVGDSIEDKSNNQKYKGLMIEDIDKVKNYAYIPNFGNGKLEFEEVDSELLDLNQKSLIEQTIKQHLETQLALTTNKKVGERIKVLSLFFIDRVDNYVNEDSKFRVWFEQIFKEVIKNPRYDDLDFPDIKSLHDGYFAVSRENKAIDTTGKTKADEVAYEKIMKNKEVLLDLNEPLQFIFSHSALNEGWDNPNVFQICNLSVSKSTIKKRQQIGRGLRIPVNEVGSRNLEEQNLNNLYIFANESFETFAKGLQVEYQEDGLMWDKRLVTNINNRVQVNFVKDWKLNPEFLELWNKINKKTTYEFQFETENLISKIVDKIKKQPPVEKPGVFIESAKLEFKDEGIESVTTKGKTRVTSLINKRVPDIIKYLQNDFEISRNTIIEIILRSGRLSDLLKNPTSYLVMVKTSIQLVFDEFKINGLVYSPTNEDKYELSMFDEDQLILINNTAETKEKTIVDRVEVDSDVEREHIKDYLNIENVEFFLRLPRWFGIETPVGPYFPDFAVTLKKDLEKIYFIKESKGSNKEEDLRRKELFKVTAGKKHFESIGVNYDYGKDSIPTLN